jgi:hypothetical protein
MGITVSNPDGGRKLGDTPAGDAVQELAVTNGPILGVLIREELGSAADAELLAVSELSRVVVPADLDFRVCAYLFRHLLARQHDQVESGFVGMIHEKRSHTWLIAVDGAKEANRMLRGKLRTFFEVHRSIPSGAQAKSTRPNYYCYTNGLMKARVPSWWTVG